MQLDFTIVRHAAFRARAAGWPEVHARITTGIFYAAPSARELYGMVGVGPADEWEAT